MPETLTQALEKSVQPDEQKTMRQLIARMEPELVKLLPKEITYERFVRTIFTEYNRTPKLYDCDPRSGLAAMLLAAQLGLEPGPLGHVYLVPFKREVTFIVGYKGIIELAYRSGQVKAVTTGIVREGDAFAFRKGTRAFLDHAEAGPPGEREWTHVYAVAELRTGGKPFEVLYPEDVEARRAKSPGARSEHSPWQTHPGPMWRKSAVHALRPYMPQTPALALALARDETPAPPVLDVGDALDVGDPGPGSEDE